MVNFCKANGLYIYASCIYFARSEKNMVLIWPKMAKIGLLWTKLEYRPK